jgi:hypothetical protein
MPICDGCGTTVVFGGVREGDERFCNAACRQATLVRRAGGLDEAEVDRRAEEVREGPCPACGGPGPVGQYRTYEVRSYLVGSRIDTTMRFCCLGCSRRPNLTGALDTLVLGPWSVFGIVLVPIFLVRNLWAALAPGGLPDAPKLFRKGIRELMETEIAERGGGVSP